MNVYDAIASKIEIEMEHTVTKIKNLIDEGDITKEKLDEITNLMIIVSNLNQAFALAKTIRKDEEDRDPTQQEESKT
tara:strand:+ start:538 stop:768 length:231 start_codon:yes stop_codon:yes gene_type:complete